MQKTNGVGGNHPPLGSPKVKSKSYTIREQDTLLLLTLSLMHNLDIRI